MDSYDIRKLRGFIKGKEASLKRDTDAVASWDSILPSTAKGSKFITAKSMRSWHEGRAIALASALTDLKELFAEELKEGE